MTPEEIRTQIAPLFDRIYELHGHLEITRHNVQQLQAECKHPFLHPTNYCPDCRLVLQR